MFAEKLSLGAAGMPAEALMSMDANTDETGKD
jgi:hypothetical protein